MRTVTHILCYEPAKPLHSLGNTLLVGRNDVAQILRVHAGGKRRRSHEVREHHGDLPALCDILQDWLFNCGKPRCGRRSSGKLTNGVEHFQPVS